MSAPTYDLGKLHGGLRLQGHKTTSTAAAIQHVPLPDVLVLPITQHVGDPAQPVVGIGEKVLQGAVARRGRRQLERTCTRLFLRHRCRYRTMAGVTATRRECALHRHRM